MRPQTLPSEPYKSRLGKRPWNHFVGVAHSIETLHAMYTTKIVNYVHVIYSEKY